MKSRVVIGWAIAAILLAATAIAAEKEGKSSTFKGLVSVAKANGRTTSITLVTDKEHYDVVMDQRGLDLSERMPNKKVEVTGFVTERDGRKLLTVQSYMPIVTGTVEAVSDSEGRITMVTLHSNEGDYIVMLDTNGIELGKKMNGKTVEVVGAVREKEQKGRGVEREFIVKNYSEVQESRSK